MRTRQRLERIHLHPDFPVVREIVDRLAPAHTVLAGGCVRDALLDVDPKDLDVATAAPPAAVEAAFARTVDVGRAFGTIVVVAGDRSIEVTTFRREGEYRDGRRPDGVEFTDATEDARRRDFTVNALFYEPATETLIDLVDGVADLRARRLRTVGDPRRRFAEDHLRMLRGVRFVAQLGFDLDEAAATAIRDRREDLRGVAGERTLAEMKRLLTARWWQNGLRVAQATGVLDVVFPECAPVAIETASTFTSWENAFAWLTLAVDPARVTARLLAWRAPRESQRRVAEQVRALGVLRDPGSPAAARVRAIGSAYAADVLALARASGLDLTADLARLAAVADGGGGLPKPFLSGADLLAAGVVKGAELGELLARLYDAQLVGELSDAAAARAWLARNRP